MEVECLCYGQLWRSGPVLLQLMYDDVARGVHLAEYFADRGELVAADLDVEHDGWTALTTTYIKGYLDIVKVLPEQTRIEAASLVALP